MKTKRKAIWLLLGMLLTVAILGSGCGNGEAPNELPEPQVQNETLVPTPEPLPIRTSERPTPEPYPTATEEPTPEPAPEPTTELIVLEDDDEYIFGITEEEEGLLIGEMPVDPDRAGEVDDYLFGVYINNDRVSDISMTVHEYHDDGSGEKARKTYGELIFGEEMEEFTFSGKPVVIEEGAAVELEIRVDITEKEDGTTVHIFKQEEQTIEVPGALDDEEFDRMLDELREEFDRRMGETDEPEQELLEYIDLNTEKKLYDGIGYFPQTKDVELFGVWEANADLMDTLVRFEKELESVLYPYENPNAPDGPSLCVQLSEQNYIIIDTVPAHVKDAMLRILQTSDLEMME